MQAICVCWECGTSVRRDDGPLAPTSEQPKRLLFNVGSGAVMTLDFCNDCFAGLLGGAQNTALLRGSRRHALAREGGDYAAGPTEATYPTSTTGPRTRGPTEAVYEPAYPSGPTGPSVVRPPTTGDPYPAGPAGPAYVAYPAAEFQPAPPVKIVKLGEDTDDDGGVKVEGDVAEGDGDVAATLEEQEAWRGRDDP